jgi:hypothetical protein
MTSNIAESYVSGLVQSYRDAFVKKQVTSPQIVVSLRVSTNWTQNGIDQFYSVINFAFDVSSNYISVFFAESKAGFNDFSKMNWKFQSRHDSCWRGDGLRHITEYYFKARKYIIGQLKNGVGYSDEQIQERLQEINSRVTIQPHFNFFVPVEFKTTRIGSFDGYALAGMKVL